MKFKKFINQCREKDVLKNLSIYIVSSWVLLQVVALMAEPLGFSTKVVAYLLLVLLIGFPLYIFWVWKYQLSSTIKKEPLLDSDGIPIPGKMAKSPFQKIYFSFLTIISILAVGISLFIVRKNFVQDPGIIELEAGDKIAVLKFKNHTKKDKFDIAGNMAEDWIIHGITQTKVGQVISPDVIENYTDLYTASLGGTNRSLVNDYLKPSKIIEGNIHLDQNKLIFLCSLSDVKSGKREAFDAACDPEAPLQCIEALKERILGFLVTEENRILNLQDTPPSYEAYQYLIQAKNQSKAGNYDASLELLNKSITADSTFFEPKVYKFMYYYNYGQYKVADSLLQKLSATSGGYERQQILLNIYKGLLEGDSRTAFEYQQKEYNYTPFHLETNTSMMVLAQQLVNKPKAVDSIYREIETKDIRLQECDNCVERHKIMGLAHIEMGQFDKAIALLAPYANIKEFEVLKKVLLRAYIRAGQFSNAEKLLTNIPLLHENQWADIYLFTIKEFLIVENRLLAEKYLKILKDKLLVAIDKNEVNGRSILAEARYLAGEYEAAEKLYQQLVEEAPSINNTIMLAIVSQKNGKSAAAEALIQELSGRPMAYQYGQIDYALAKYYATLNQETNTFKHLLQAVADGHWYETSAFQNDYLFSSYFKREDFKEILNFWH